MISHSGPSRAPSRVNEPTFTPHDNSISATRQRVIGNPFSNVAQPGGHRHRRRVEKFIIFEGTRREKRGWLGWLVKKTNLSARVKWLARGCLYTDARVSMILDWCRDFWIDSCQLGEAVARCVKHTWLILKEGKCGE